tara:strand:- start:586 stop:816 length:231 start_codon:yes stop_codon:yes gene_type:complete
MFKLDDLYGEKALLQKDFDELRSRIGKVEMDLNTMKNNLNALNGAIQQTNKLIKMAEEYGHSVATPEGKLKKNIKK